MSINCLQTSLQETEALLKENEHKLYRLSSKEERLKIFRDKVCASYGINGHSTDEDKREVMEKFARSFATKPLTFNLKEIPSYLAQKVANLFFDSMPANWTEEEIAQELGRRKVASNGESHDLLPEVLTFRYVRSGGSNDWGYFGFRKVGQRNASDTYKMWTFGDPDLKREKNTSLANTLSS